MTEAELLERVIKMQNVLVEITSMPEYYPGLKEDEITEQRLFHLINLRNEIKELVMEIDPNRFAPVRAYSMQYQEMTVSRLHLCDICGSTRCQSDHK